MKLFILLAIFFLAIGWLGGWLYNPYQTTNDRLIEAWRQVQPGMTDSEVEETIGSATYKFESGGTWPDWTTRSLPEGLASDNSLHAYYIGGWGPQFLLVVFDADHKVSFAGSTHT